MACSESAPPGRLVCSRQVTVVARKGRARRFREARELKEGFDDDLFREGSKSLADVVEGDDEPDEEDDWEDEEEEKIPWDPDLHPET